MTGAYDELYLDNARRNMACMLDYAVYGLEVELSKFYDLFIATGIAKRFGRGEPKIVVGQSGIELANLVMEEAGLKRKTVELKTGWGRSKEYWAGWAVAYYQWESEKSFALINEVVPVTEIRDMYNPFHEMDIRQFSDRIDEIFDSKKVNETMLARLRSYADLSQSELAKESGVSIRTIQKYERREKDISKAGAENLNKLAKVLNCDVNILTEKEY